VDPNLVLFGVLVAAIYLLIIAPARNRKRRADDIKANLKPGAEVMTTAGMFGVVTEATDTDFHIEISPGVVVRFAIGAVGKITVPKDGDKEATGGARDEVADGPQDGDGPSSKKL
jgi:preprotein translocase subunit YajC